MKVLITGGTGFVGQHLQEELQRRGLSFFAFGKRQFDLTRWENAEELINVAHKFGNTGWRQALLEFLEEVALIAEIDQKDESKDAVTLMTLHSAKGLEFDNVFFVGLEEGILPHSRSLIDPEELSEEIRLAYVGLTRARRRLFLVYTHSRRVFGNVQQNQPSRILKVLPRDKVETLVREQFLVFLFSRAHTDYFYLYVLAGNQAGQFDQFSGHVVDFHGFAHL